MEPIGGLVTPRRWTLEFGLVDEGGEAKAFGAGLLSSAGEL
jgi:phenylalanine-4-hydroxylase